MIQRIDSNRRRFITKGEKFGGFRCLLGERIKVDFLTLKEL